MRITICSNSWIDGTGGLPWNLGVLGICTFYTQDAPAVAE